MNFGTLVGGGSSVHARHASDFYRTPVEATVALCRHFPHLRAGIVWEPAAGGGDMVRGLYEGGAILVVPTEFRTGDDVHGRGGVDFLTEPLPDGVTSIVTNPPFNLAVDFIRRARSHGVPFAMLLKQTFWNAARRMDLFHETGPSAIGALTWRLNFVPSRGSSPPMDCCWTVWDDAPSKTCRFFPMEREM